MKIRREKKSETLEVRLPHSQKTRFMAATKQQGETASQALRRYIADYVERAELASQTHPVKELTMTLARHRFKTLASALAASFGLFAFSALPSAADASAFEHLDANKDGLITEGEILPGEDADIIAKLDTDSSGGVSPEEFAAAGDKIVIRKSESHTDEDGQEVVRKKVKVLRFSEDGENQVRTKIESDAHKVIRIEKRGGKPMSDEELDAMIAEHLEDVEGEAEVEVEITVD